MDDAILRDIQTSYDRVADEYVQRIFDELQHKPLDRELLDRFAARVRDVGSVCDIGCGPGQVARYVKEQGVDAFGLDLSPEMVACARRLNPDIAFRQGNLLSLDMEDGALAGITAFYSLIHLPRAEVVTALCELRRVLQPNGVLLLAFHIGEHTVHLEEWWGRQVSVDFTFFGSEEMAGYLRTADFEVEERIERAPYPDVEHPSRRAYLFARKRPHRR